MKSKVLHNLFVFYIYFLCIKNSFASKPNVLLIVLDDLKTALNCYNDNLAYTPNINKLASSSFVFQNTFAQQAICAPSRNSFLTSRRPDTLHLYDFYNYWREFTGNFTTLPQHFKEHGYFTKSIGKIFHPGVSSNNTDDFPYSWSEVPFHPSTEKYKNSKVCLDPDGSLKKNLICPVIVESQPENTLPDIQSTDEAVRFLRSRNSSNGLNYFLAVGLHKPHIPFKFPVEYLKYHPLEKIKLPKNRFRPSLLPNVAWNPWTDLRQRDDIRKLNISFPYGPMPDFMTKKIIQSYNSAVTYVDDLIGKILQEVDDNTIIVITSDHGWSYGEHGEFSKFSNFEVATKVPLMINVPQLSKKKVIINKPVELVDLFPTLVDLTQISKPLTKCPKDYSLLCTEGKSLVSLMYDTLYSLEVRGKFAAFSQYPRPGSYPTNKPNSDKPHLKDIKIMGYTMRTEQYRYTEWIKFYNNNFTLNWNTKYGVELYDHLIDPEENMNLAGREELRNLTKILHDKLKLGWRYAQE